MPTKPIVYFFSGLGANKQTFELLTLDWCEPIFVAWEPPQPQETLAEYALRLHALRQIPNDATLVGLSFGGMLVTEICKQYPNSKGYLISSNTGTHEFPLWLKVGKYIPAYRWSPFAQSNRYNLLLRWFLGPKKGTVETSLKGIIAASNPLFTQWAIDAIMHWSNRTVPANIERIHGTADKLLPAFLIKNATLVRGGTHLMIMNNASIVSQWLQQKITN
ncbi:MAG: alpha/beta hydrolase [Chitinophagaceae bacterium]